MVTTCERLFAALPDTHPLKVRDVPLHFDDLGDASGKRRAASDKRHAVMIPDFAVDDSILVSSGNTSKYQGPFMLTEVESFDGVLKRFSYRDGCSVGEVREMIKKSPLKRIQKFSPRRDNLFGERVVGLHRYKSNEHNEKVDSILSQATGPTVESALIFVSSEFALAWSCCGRRQEGRDFVVSEFAEGDSRWNMRS